MYNSPSLLIGVVISILFPFKCGQALLTKPSPTPFHDWDYLVFSQRWPFTACTEWEHANNTNKCNLPKDEGLWTIHGLWPTKIGQKGPFFCPSAIHFDPNQLTPMLDDLNDHWINIRANTKPNSFWSHEWDKHGTCASILPILDSVPNYFLTALKLNKKYDFTTILKQGGITPSSTGYNVSQIYNTVMNSIQKEPSIQCVVDPKTKESYFNEIRICFNKTMDLIDCTTAELKHRGNYKINTNCNQAKFVQYIPSVETLTELSDKADLENYDESIQVFEQLQFYTNLYNFISALFWTTL